MPAWSADGGSSRRASPPQAHKRTPSQVYTIFLTMIITENLEQTYESVGRSLTVLRNINLCIGENDFVAVVGPSGSGKTTLLGLLAGLDLPTSGYVAIDGQNLSELSEDERSKLRAEKIGFVFQTFQLIPTLTALENVLVPIELLPTGRVSGNDLPQRARGLLERVGLGDRLDHYPTQLSGGEQQRVGLARAFANEPRILFADEPTGNLDVDTGALVADLLVQLNREMRTTLVLVTHDQKLASRAPRIIRLEGGKIVADTNAGQS